MQLKYTIMGVSKILVPQDQIYFLKGIGLVKGNKKLANSWNGILELFYQKNKHSTLRHTSVQKQCCGIASSSKTSH